MKVFKIRDPKTGLFANGRSWARWSKLGRSYSSLTNLKLHLAHVDGRYGSYSASAEVVEYDIVEVSARPLRDIQ